MKRIVLIPLILGILQLASSSRLWAEGVNPTTVYLPAIAPYTRCAPRAPTLFGVEMYGDTRASSPFYPFLLESGANWVRAPINWREIEPVNVTPDQYNWAHADRVVAAVGAACMHMIVTHAEDPTWSETGTDGPLAEFGMRELAEYLAALVERYDGDGNADAPGSPIIRHWEIYNEPDDTIPLYGGRWGFAGEEYAKLLAIVYPAIKAADPQAQVLMGGIAHDWYKDQPSPFSLGFLDDVLDAGGGDYFDIMNFHTYPPYAANWAQQGPGLLEKTEYIRAKLARYGLDKPIIITETAHHSNAAWEGVGGSHEMQMRYVAQLYTQAAAANVQVLIWFALADPGPHYPFDSGLVTRGPPGAAKPAFAVYQTAVQQLSHARFVRRLSPVEISDSAMEAYEFVDDARAATLTVAWLDPVTTTATSSLSLPGAQAVVYDMAGEVATVVDTDDGRADGAVHITVTGSPIYIWRER